MVLLGLYLNGKPWLLSTTSLTPTPPAPPAPGAGTNSYTVTNPASSSSPGFWTQGAMFRRGDVPVGSIPVSSAGTLQFYAVSRWTDGSLKTARVVGRDATYAPAEVRVVTLTSATGTLPSGAVATAGNAGLVSALAGHTAKVDFSSVQTLDGAAVYGSGTMTAVLADHAAVGTRWTLQSTGPVADVWQGWGMAVNGTTGAPDAHLKVNWYVIRVKNADGSTAGLQVAPVVALDWWSVAGAAGLSYNAVFSDNGSPVASYPGVTHPYRSQWLVARADGTAPWLGTAATLSTIPAKDYLVSTGLIGPLRQTSAPAAAAPPTYVPCENMEHRAAIDGTGGYMGRGVMTTTDAAAFMRSDTQAYTRARINALAALSIPYHYRCNSLRTRPGEAADISNTMIPLKLAPKVSSYADFTAYGMPAARDAYNGGNSPDEARDGYVYPTGGSGVWQPSGDASHAVSYGYYIGLVEGSPWLAEATVDLASNLAHQSIYGFHNSVINFAGMYGIAGVPTDHWTGLLGQFQNDNQRAMGWAQLLQGCAVVLTPDDHVASGYIKARHAHNGDYIGGVLDYLPPQFAAGGVYNPPSGLGINATFSPWMNGFEANGAYLCYLATEDARWKRMGDHCANWAIRNALAGRWYAFDQYRTAVLASADFWNATTNPILTAETQPFLQIGGNITASTGVFSTPYSVYWNTVNQAPPPLKNGDVLYFTRATQLYANGTVPAGVAEGTKVYVINCTNGTHMSGAYPPDVTITYQVSATPGGAAMTFGQDGWANLSWTPQALADYAVPVDNGDYLKWPYMPHWDNYVPVSITTLMLARQAGNTLVTTALRDAANAFVAPMAGIQYTPEYDTLATV